MGKKILIVVIYGLNFSFKMQFLKVSRRFFKSALFSLKLPSPKVPGHTPNLSVCVCVCMWEIKWVRECVKWLRKDLVYYHRNYQRFVLFSTKYHNVKKHHDVKKPKLFITLRYVACATEKFSVWQKMNDSING